MLASNPASPVIRRAAAPPGEAYELSCTDKWFTQNKNASGYGAQNPVYKTCRQECESEPACARYVIQRNQMCFSMNPGPFDCCFGLYGNPGDDQTPVNCSWISTVDVGAPGFVYPTYKGTDRVPFVEWCPSGPSERRPELQGRIESERVRRRRRPRARPASARIGAVVWGLPGASVGPRAQLVRLLGFEGRRVLRAPLFCAPQQSAPTIRHARHSVRASRALLLLHLLTTQPTQNLLRTPPRTPPPRAPPPADYPGVCVL